MVRRILVLCLCLLLLATPILAETATVFIDGPIVAGWTFTLLRRDLMVAGVNTMFRNEKVDHLVVVINSPGGSVSESLAIYEFLVSLHGLGVTVDTVATGMCMSAGMTILQAGDTRYATKRVSLMTHRPLVVIPPHEGYIPLKEKELQEIQDQLDQAFERTLGVFINRMEKERSELVLYFTDEEFFMDAVTAYQLGFIDIVIQDPVNYFTLDKMGSKK